MFTTPLRTGRSARKPSPGPRSPGPQRIGDHRQSGPWGAVPAALPLDKCGRLWVATLPSAATTTTLSKPQAGHTPKPSPATGHGPPPADAPTPPTPPAPPATPTDGGTKRSSPLCIPPFAAGPIKKMIEAEAGRPWSAQGGLRDHGSRHLG